MSVLQKSHGNASESLAACGYCGFRLLDVSLYPRCFRVPAAAYLSCAEGNGWREVCAKCARWSGGDNVRTGQIGEGGSSIESPQPYEGAPSVGAYGYVGKSTRGEALEYGEFYSRREDRTDYNYSSVIDSLGGSSPSALSGLSRDDWIETRRQRNRTGKQNRK